MALRIAALALAVIGGFAPGVLGQDGATVAGRVLDQTGALLPGVTVDLRARQAELTGVTDASGAFRFERVPPGSAELTFRLINFVVLRQPIDVRGDAVTAPDAVMTLSLKADVIVTGAATFRDIADVERPSENLVGIAASASQGAVTAERLELRPIMRAGEVLEAVPGMVISQHSGEGKANQYYLRGFSLDHGTDFATTVAGVPVNTPTGAHAHGYADVGFLIPELVAGVQYKKGPYFADEGDFSSAGAANISYVNRLEQPTVRATTGSYGWNRVFAAASPRVGAGHLLGAVEVSRSDGPWDRPDGYGKINGVLGYSTGDGRNGFSLTGMGYWADWDSTDQVPVRAIAEGVISRFGFIDPTDGGNTSRQSLAVELQRSSTGSSLRASGYLLRHTLDLFSNFTYFLDDPENGDQFEQSERRIATGGRVTYRRLGHVLGRHTESAIGGQVRQDWVNPVGLYHTTGRRRLGTTREDRVGQTMIGAFGQAEIEWSRAVRTTVGLRTDVYRFDVASSSPVSSGSGSDALVSPKAGAVLGPWAGTEVYLNAGTGFHSNDARGAAARVDPVTALARTRGVEIGVRTVSVPGVQSTFALWYLGLESELLFVGDAGTTEASRPSRRLGIEWSSYARLNAWLTADADISFSRARFTDDGPAGNRVPGALDRVVAAGLAAHAPGGLFGSVRVRHFGPRPLIEAGSVRSESTTLWNTEIGYRFPRKVRVFAEVFNIFDADAADIDYFYASRLPWEPEGGIEGIHTHPAMPRSFRLTFEVDF